MVHLSLQHHLLVLQLLLVMHGIIINLGAFNCSFVTVLSLDMPQEALLVLGYEITIVTFNQQQWLHERVYCAVLGWKRC